MCPPYFQELIQGSKHFRERHWQLDWAFKPRPWLIVEKIACACTQQPDVWKSENFQIETLKTEQLAHAIFLTFPHWPRFERPVNSPLTEMFRSYFLALIQEPKHFREW